MNTTKAKKCAKMATEILILIPNFNPALAIAISLPSLSLSLSLSLFHLSHQAHLMHNEGIVFVAAGPRAKNLKTTVIFVAMNMTNKCAKLDVKFSSDF